MTSDVLRSVAPCCVMSHIRHGVLHGVLFQPFPVVAGICTLMQQYLRSRVGRGFCCCTLTQQRATVVALQTPF